MTDPGSSMSPVAILVLTVVVLVLMAGWLGAVFFAAREPGGSARPGNEDPARARQREDVTHRGDMPAGAHVDPSAGQPGDGGTDKMAARGAGQAG